MQAFIRPFFLQRKRCTDRIGVNMACVEGVDVFAAQDIVVGGGKKLSLVTDMGSAG